MSQSIITELPQSYEVKYCFKFNSWFYIIYDNKTESYFIINQQNINKDILKQFKETFKDYKCQKNKNIVITEYNKKTIK